MKYSIFCLIFFVVWSSQVLGDELSKNRASKIDFSKLNDPLPPDSFKILVKKVLAREELERKKDRLEHPTGRITGQGQQKNKIIPLESAKSELSSKNENYLGVLGEATSGGVNFLQKTTIDSINKLNSASQRLESYIEAALSKKATEYLGVLKNVTLEGAGFLERKTNDSVEKINSASQIIQSSIDAALDKKTTEYLESLQKATLENVELMKHINQMLESYFERAKEWVKVLENK